MAEEGRDGPAGDYLRIVEVAIYHTLAVLLSITALATIAGAV
jgi:hypothetical protein